MRTSAPATLALVVALVAVAAQAPASTILDYVTFDGIDYVRWPEEPGRMLGVGDLGVEFATVECAFGDGAHPCPYGLDAAAAFLPAGTRMHAVHGHATSFRLAAVWNDRIFLYQAWRSAHARTGRDLFDIRGKVRSVEVQRGGLTPPIERHPVTIAAAADVEALVEMIARSPVRRPQPHAVAEARYWLTLWLTDGTTLGRPYFVESGELMGGVMLPPEFRAVLERYLAE